MQSTLSTIVPEYIGAHLTGRYSAQCRDIDVCGLAPGRRHVSKPRFGIGGGTARHSRWMLPSSRRNSAPPWSQCSMAPRPSPERAPRFGAASASLRRWERPGHAPGPQEAIRGFICSSLDLFTALKREGIAINPPVFIGGVSEVYPGHIWTILGGRRPLPRKATEAGRLARKRILEALGVCGLSALPSHDQNDACVAALVAAAADNQVPGVSAVSIGESLSIDPDGALCEGPMIIPRLTEPAAERIALGIRDIYLPAPPSPHLIQPPSTPSAVAADDLLAFFIAKALEGKPQVGTYGWAYRRLFASYVRISQAYTRQVIALACRTRPRELPGLGLVRLDAFIVSKKDGLPSTAYWPAANHDREEWDRALGNSTILD